MRTSRLYLLLVAVLSRLVSAPAIADTAADPTLVLKAIRQGDDAAVSRIAQASSIPNQCDAEGNTPLIIAAHIGTPGAVKSLLELKADPNATNRAGVTALLRAAADPEKVALLLAHGANPNVRSSLGHTPLMLAARSPRATESVRLLLEHKADVNARSLFGATALMAACAAANLDVVRALVEAGAEVNGAPVPSGDLGPEAGHDPIWGGLRSPLMWAALRNDPKIIAYLIDHDARVNEVAGFGTALSQTGWGHRTEAAKVLLERGANPALTEPFSGYTALHWAASAEDGEADLVKLLLDRGADPNAQGGQPVDAFLGATLTPLDLASQRGRTRITEALLAGGARDSGEETCCDNPTNRREAKENSADAVSDVAVLEAITSAMAPLQHTAEYSLSSFRRHSSRQACVSCHQQYLPMMAAGTSRQLDVSTDARRATELVKAVLDNHRNFELDQQPLFHPEPTITYGYSLLGLKLMDVQDAAVTDPLVHHLASIQALDGHWDLNLFRPPMQSSPVTATAMGIFALRHFGWPARAAEFEARASRAKDWLRKAQPSIHEARVFQLLGLRWAGVSEQDLKPLAMALLKEQRPDGGWAQLAGLGSDAYATGQALFALFESGGLAANAPAFQKAVRFLLDTQDEDGSWHVRRRAFPFQPTMNSGFPHGRDSWISAAGSSWAVMALSRAADRTTRTIGARATHRDGDKTKNVAAQAEKPAAVLASRAGAAPEANVDFARDIQAILERSCLDCHSGERARSGYRVHTREAFLSAGNLGERAVVPGKSRESLLLRYVSGEVDDLTMPPQAKREEYPALTEREIGKLRAWIDQGAVWPADLELKKARQN